MFRIECYNSITRIPVPYWERLALRQTVGLEIEHLRAIELSGINNLHPYYLIGYENEEPVGIAYCFSIEIDLARMANTYPPKVLESVKIWKPGFMQIRLLEVGHIASLGAAIEVNKASARSFLNMLSVKIDEIARIENSDLCLIRDISLSDYADFSILMQVGFQPVMGFPVARMKVAWESLEEYTASLKSKKRKNVLLKMEKLKAPEIAVEVIDDYAPYADRLAQLWTNVALNNNGYEHERLTPAFFVAMSENLKGRSHVVAIKRYGEIVAYGLNLIGDDEYFGVAEGMDYELRDQYDLYANNFFEALRMACHFKKKIFNLGITSYDFKTSIGAELDPCIYFVKALKQPCYTSVYADLIGKSIDQPENKHRVFRNETTSNREQLRKSFSILNKQTDSLDPFARHYRYIRVDKVRSANLYTYCPVFESAQEPVIKHEGREVIMLGTNSYLGLATHPRVKQAAHEAIDKYGSGCSGSPLLNGTLDLHQQLSGELARFLGKEDTLLFTTGYQTNVGVISALVCRNDVLIMDERNHASLVDGARLSRATLARYKHNNIDSLEQLLKKYANQPKLIVTDSLFSMEGTIVDLPEIVELAKKYKARLMLDESHALGVMGPGGRGVAEYYGLTNEVDVIMGTFSKSFASVGGFVAGDRKLIDTLRHTSRSHIFSASLPPSAVAAVLASLKIIIDEPERRTRLLANAGFLAKGLKELGYDVHYNGSPIVPLLCGHELIAVAAFNKLFENGVFVNPVTSPAVPKNHEMLRISLMATHTEEILLKALAVFKQLRTTCWPEMNSTR
jgi:8-amino-7-oxononanoate synthase